MAVTLNIPSQVKTYANLAAFPASGSLKTIYIAEDTNKTYRWDGSTYVEISASAATGLTIGTTAIASGTIGRVLFQGTGNVLQQSSSLFWDNTNARLELTTADNVFATFLKASTGQLKIKPYLNPTFGVLMESRNAADSAYLPFTISGSKIQLADGNVLINTTTDAGFRLDVNGTARVQGSATILTNAGRLTLQQTVGGSVFNGINFNDFSSLTNASIINNQNTGEFRIFTNASYFPTFYSNGLERMRIATTGNVLINTTTDAGFKLDVNGTARIQAALSVTNQSQILGTGRILSEIYYNAKGQSTTPNTRFISYGIGRPDGGFGNTILAGMGGFFSGAAWPNGIGLSFFTAEGADISGGASTTEKMTITAGGNVLINTTTNIASSKLTIESTTQGFLPPRMTTTQRNAIASPAAGLVVYDNTDNKHYGYNGTTWNAFY